MEFVYVSRVRTLSVRSTTKEKGQMYKYRLHRRGKAIYPRLSTRCFHAAAATGRAREAAFPSSSSKPQSHDQSFPLWQQLFDGAPTGRDESDVVMARESNLRKRLRAKKTWWLFWARSATPVAPAWSQVCVCACWAVLRTRHRASRSEERGGSLIAGGSARAA